MRPHEIARRRRELSDEAAAIIARSGDRLGVDDNERFGEIDAELDELNRAEADRLEQRELVRSYAGGGYSEPGDGASGGSVSRTRWGRDDTNAELSRAMSVVERDGQKMLRSDQLDQLDSLLRADPTDKYNPTYIAKRILVTENPIYRSAFTKYLASQSRGYAPLLSGEENDALRAYDQLERAMGEVTTTAGGFGVPVFLDPSIIVTSGAADVPILRYCRIEQVTSNIWKGVSSAGMSWSYDTEAAEVSDDSPTLAQPSITVHMARGFIPFSIEVSQDYADFSAEMGLLLNQGFSDLLAAKTMTGTGTGEPWGIFTAIDQTSASEVTPTTDGSFGAVDIFKVWNALPERYRARATWVMSVPVESAIRQFAAAAGSSSSYFTVDLSADGLSRINGRPVITTDYAPTFSGSVPGTTGPANILVVGDFSNYVYANRAGMSVETVNHLFGGSARPTGQRGLFAWSRNGADSVNDAGARLLQNQ